MDKKTLQNRVAFITIFTPLTVVILTMLLGWIMHIGISEIVLFIIMYILSILGITAGYHRYFTHSSFEIHPLGAKILLILGSMAGQGPVLYWVSTHRLHHQKSDREGDPHSPNLKNKETLKELLTSLGHAHFGWMLKYHSDYWYKYVPDLLKNRMIIKVNMQYFYWLFLGILIPGFINLCIHGTLDSFLSGILWGGMIRIFIGHHCTWAVNSVCHLFGKQDYETNDNSRNNYLFGLLSLGEGFHNNHHAFPSSAKHGLLPHQFDFTYFIINLLKRLKIVKNIKLPKKHLLERKRISNE